MMTDIYAKAVDVIVWLGEEKPEDKHAFLLLRHFRDIFSTQGYFEYDPFEEPGVTR